MALKVSSKKSSFKKPTIVVGIGASAGGSAAFKQFFGGLESSGLVAYVVVQHTDLTGQGLALEILKNLSRFPVLEIKSGLRLEAQNVYVAPPHSLVTIEDGVFALEPAGTVEICLTVFDCLLKSLAAAFTTRSVGIVLSGDGFDGALGLRSISEHGGMTIAQDPKTTEHSSMPENAIQTGCIDHILRPSAIGKQLLSYEDYILNVIEGKALHSMRDQIGLSLHSICGILLKETHHDFKHYKTTTLIRRIQRRMQVLQIESAEIYIQRLVQSPQEVDLLFKELLINVTSFFRDSDSFQILKEEVLSKSLEQLPKDQKFRVWVAGCSSGEEVYTLAILIQEEILKLGREIEVQIIATDIDDVALSQARKGSYPLSIADSVSPERLSKYFQKRAGRYHVQKEVREMCLFSAHNLINDPPFSHLDLISCRNVLIYLGTHLQKKLIPVFHYGLKDNGYLFLGTSESISSHKDLFKTVSAKHRIAQRKATAIRPSTTFSAAVTPNFHPHEAQRNLESDIHLVSQRIVLDEFSSRYAVINEDCQIISVSSGLQLYLEPPEGSFQNNLVKMVRPSLRFSLRSALNDAKKYKRKVDVETATLKYEDGLRRVGITVQPMPQLGDESGLYMVAFHKLSKIDSELRSGAANTSSNEIQNEVQGEMLEQLERELNLLRADLEKTVQDLEASNEELKSSNEELLSMNEELQSANEELETSKEDVQESSDALLQSHTDLENLLASTDIATLFLNDDMQIHSFTPALRGIYNITETDIGRPIGHFTHVAKSMPDYPNFEMVAESASALETNIELNDGRHLLRRITPYKTTSGTYCGMVVTFIDVTKLWEIEGQRSESEARFEIMANNAPVLVWMSNTEKLCTWFNKEWYSFTGRSFEQEYGNGWAEGVHPDDLQRCLNHYVSHFDARKEFYMEYRLRHHTGEYRWLSDKAVPRFTSANKFAGFIGACMDIHEIVLARKTVEDSKAAIENERENFRHLFRQTPEMVCILRGPEHLFEFVNEAHVKVLGFDATGMFLRQAQPESIEVHDILDDVYRTGVTAELKEIPVTLGNRIRYFNLTYSARFDTSMTINGVMILGTEVTDQVLSFDSIKAQKAALELTLRGADIKEVLSVLTKMLEDQLGNGSIASTLLLDPTGERLVLGAAPNLPPEFSKAIDNIPVGPNVGSCGTAAFRNETVIVRDIETSPLWGAYKEIALKFNLQACWAAPIVTPGGPVLGTFAVYYNETRSPSEAELRLLKFATKTAALVIERKLAQEQIINSKVLAEEARSAAEIASESKTQFLANMSHEIRTPLAAILGFSDLLKADQHLANSEASEYLQRISRNASHLGRLIDELLDLSKIEADKLEIDQIEFNLMAALDDSLSGVSHLAHEKGIQINVHIESSVPKKIVTDPTRLRQVLLNIIGNAVKFTNEGSIHVNISIHEPFNNILAVRVIDTGIGLSEQQKSNLFKPFVQADNSVTRKYGGTGLGLALSKKLAHLMGGDLIVERSEINEGSSFLLTVKLQPAPPVRVETSKTAMQSFLAQPLKDKKILIVDDAPDNQTILRIFITKAGGLVEIANNGQDALDKMKLSAYDLVLMDIQMPVLDGYQALKAAVGAGYKAPIVAITAHAMKDEKIRCLAAGFRDYLSKPVNRTELINKIVALTH